MSEECEDQFGLSAFEAVNGVLEIVAMGVHVRAARIRQLHMLEVLPDIFVRIQIRGVTGRAFQPDRTVRRCQRGFHVATAMDRRTVPNDQQAFIEGLLQVLQEAGREFAVDRAFVGSEGTATIARDAADDRKMVAGMPFGEDGVWPQGAQVRATDGSG